MAAVCKGKGHAYIFKKKTGEAIHVKVGCSKDVDRRLRDVAGEHPGTEFVEKFETSYMMEAEDTVKEALENEFKMKKTTPHSNDWYILPDRIPQYFLTYIVKSEVNQVNLRNDLDKAKKKIARLEKQKK